MDTQAESRYKPTEVEKAGCEYLKNACHLAIVPQCEDCIGCMVMTMSIFATSGYDVTNKIDGNFDPEMMGSDEREPLTESMTGCRNGATPVNPLKFVYLLLKEFGI